MQVLSREVNLEYMRAMNKLTFDETVASMPEAFPYVTLPEKVEEKVKQTGR